MKKQNLQKYNKAARDISQDLWYKLFSFGWNSDTECPINFGVDKTLELLVFQSWYNNTVESVTVDINDFGNPDKFDVYRRRIKESPGNIYKKLQKTIKGWTQELSLAGDYVKAAELFLYEYWFFRKSKEVMVEGFSLPIDQVDIIDNQSACNYLEYNLKSVCPGSEEKRYLTDTEPFPYYFTLYGKHEEPYHIIKRIKDNEELNRIKSIDIYFLKKDLEEFKDERDKAKAERVKCIEELSKTNKPAPLPPNPEHSEVILKLGQLMEFRTVDLNYYGSTQRDLNNYFANDKVVEGNK